MINFLADAAEPFNIGRHVIRRYITSCQKAARKADKMCSGIVSPEIHADILETITKHKFYRSAETLDHLHNTLPKGVCFKKGKKGLKQKKLMNRNKFINDRIKRARQYVDYNYRSSKYETSWITREELEAKYGWHYSHEVWENSCFSGHLKWMQKFEKPVTQAQARVNASMMLGSGKLASSIGKSCVRSGGKKMKHQTKHRV